MPTLRERVKRSWSAFMGRDPTKSTSDVSYGYSTSFRPDRQRLTRTSASSIVSGVYNRIALDVAAIKIRHVKVDDNGNYVETIDSDLNNCLSVEANLDQTGRSLIQDIVMSMFDEGVVAVVPVAGDVNLTRTGFNEGKIYSLRTGRIIAWYPEAVKVNVYNELTGKREDITVPKRLCAIIENPLYSVMNEPNSTLQRLIRTLSKLDIQNDQSTSGKLDLIIQLAYQTNSDRLKERAENRRKQLEEQLSGSKYGIAYSDGTERIIQLNRAVENTLWEQVEKLTERLYNQLGLTKAIFDGTADEQAMINYNNRSVEPILATICDEFERKFLTATARTQHQAINYFMEPFKLVPTSQLAEIADKFTRNEILTSNEFRAIVGYKPVDTERANQLLNKNVNHPGEEGVDPTMDVSGMTEEPSSSIPVETQNSEAPPDDYEGMLNWVRNFNGGAQNEV